MIRAESLSKHYGAIRAVDGISFAIEPGEIVGLLGPNGAGKTTTMRMCAGYLAPTSGSVQVHGFDLLTDTIAARKTFGYLPEGAPLWGEMTPRAFLDFIADVRELKGERRAQRIGEVTGLLQLESVLEQRIETLSKGFRRRVGLAQAILHDPPVLLLDEPTDGLDPNQKHEVRELIRGMSSDKIVVISTHILEEVEAVCSRAIIIAAGRIVADDSPAALAAQSETNRLDRVFRRITTGQSRAGADRDQP